VATLLEAARAFMSEPAKPRRSVLIIANTGEEVGLLGADYFARNPTVPADKLVAGVDLDMPVLTYDFTDVIAYGAGHSTLSQAIARAGASMGLTLSPDPDPEQATFVRSDHYMLVKAGVPAVMLADGYANGGKAAWETFQAKHYHQVSDDLRQPILWEQGAKFARLNYLIARDLADADEPPRWYQGDYFGDLFAPNAPRAPAPKKP
jgi:Zn-dependent M28 family amino/carboxypeptidase